MTLRNTALFFAALFAPAFSLLAADFGPVTIDIGQVLTTSSTYGYAEIPLYIENISKEDVTVTIIASGRQQAYTPGTVLGHLSRTFRAPAESTMTVAIHQPAMVLAEGTARVYINGALHRQVLSLPARAHMGVSTSWGQTQDNHTLLMDSAIPAVTRDTIVNAAAELSAAKGSFYNDPYTTQVAHTDTWPASSWLGYTRFLAVAISEARWTTLTSERRRALLDFVAGSGTLVIVGSESVPALPGDHAAFAPRLNDSGHQGPVLTFGLGSVIAAHDALLTDEWEELIRGAETATRWRIPTRRIRNDTDTLPMTDHLNVPVRSLLVVLVVFGVLIGPVNIFVLTFIRRPVLLFLTTPIIGIVFAAGVFAFGLLADGVRPSARSMTLTILDQPGQTAVSATLAAYYAPLTPGNGIVFSSEACVMPSTDSESYDFNTPAIRLDQSGAEQRFTSGLIRARLPAYLRVLTVETRRERVLIEPSPDGPVALNGFAADIDALWHADENGTLYTAAAPIASGAQATLVPVAEEAQIEPGDWTRVADALAGAPRRGLLDHVLRGRDRAPNIVPFNGYVARLSAPLFFEPGLDNLATHDAETVVVGLLARQQGASDAR